MTLFERSRPLLALLIPITALAQPEDLPLTGTLPGPVSVPARTAACPQAVVAPALPEPPDRTGAPLIFEAESFDGRQGDVAVARGNVEVRRADQYLASDHVRYDLASGRAVMPGPMSYRDAQFWINAERAEYGLRDQDGEFENVTYGITGSSAHGRADHVRVEGGAHSWLTGIEYTTCPGEEPDWQLSAKELELKHDEGVGYAKHARLDFKGVPLLYVPWMTFPIDDRRKSGFLFPFLQKANDNGFEIGVPWYWNIAPNQDATITPRYFTDRGAMLGAEWRHISRSSGSRVDFDVLFDDDITGETRYRYEAQHEQGISEQWHAGLDLNRVSDEDYFLDFGDNLAQTSLSYLRSQAGIDGGGRYWTFAVTADDFQVIDSAVGPEEEPYRRLPRLTWTLDRPIGGTGLLWSIESEAVYFSRDVGVEGARADVFSAVTWDKDLGWGYLRPSVGYRWTGYELEDTEPGQPGSPDRGLGIYSFDSGLRFDRLQADGDVQTLEPRLFYLYVPFEEQGELPDFDTGPLTFGFSSLFHHNQFTGADRQSNANQLTLALSTRTFSAETGRERWRLSVGQMLFFEDRLVTLPDEASSATMPDDNVSPFLAEFSWNPFNRFNTRAGIQWDWENSELDVAMLGADWVGERGQLLGFEYRFRRDRVDQVDLRALWPLGQNWRVFSRVNYSFEDSDLLEAQAGVEYESCCWAVRVVGRRYLRDREGEFRDAIYLELQLKGLASVGRRTQTLFDAITR